MVTDAEYDAFGKIVGWEITKEEPTDTLKRRIEELENGKKAAVDACRAVHGELRYQSGNDITDAAYILCREVVKKEDDEHKN